MIASIPSPSSNGFAVGPFEIHAYGLMYALAVTAAVLIVRRRWEKLGGDPDLVYDVALWGFPAGLIGGRIYFDITSFEPKCRTPGTARSRSGTAAWGSGAGSPRGAAVGLWRVHRAGVSVPDFMDATAPALLVAQAIGRVGNYFNQELFGGPTSLPWAPPDLTRPPPRGLPPLRHLPADLPLRDDLEPGARRLPGLAGPPPQDPPPGLFALYVTGYSAFRIFEESLRVDPAHHILGHRLNFWVAIVLTLVGIAWFVWTQRRDGHEPIEPVEGAGFRANRTKTVPSS